MIKVLFLSLILFFSSTDYLKSETRHMDSNLKYSSKIDSVLHKCNLQIKNLNLVNSNNANANYIILANISCGIPPIPPIGCVIGNCVCDSGGNCSWQTICN